MKYVILYNIRSSHNVGSIFRTCDGAGVNKIFLVGYTPAPIDRFGRPVTEINKTSLGASTMVPWEKVDDVADLIKRLQSIQVQVVAVEQVSGSVSLYDYNEPEKVAYVMGNEVEGVPSEVVSLCDMAIEIPMCGRKESLNVSVATGIVLFQKRHES